MPGLEKVVMLRMIKRTVLHLAKWLGLFGLARRITRRKLRILAYHGFASDDEAAFRPGLFMRPETFRRRLAHLARSRYPVLPLGEALELLGEDRLPDRTVVITVDDGFYGFYRNALAMLGERRFAATVYVTSYYCRHPGPVFRLAVQYMFWRASGRPVELDGLGIEGLPGGVLRRAREVDEAMWTVIRHGETACDEPGRHELAEALGGCLGVDYDQIRRRRILDLMRAEELRELPGAGIDIQLHTHRHVLPDDEAGVRREIAENRSYLVGLLGRPAQHFCYPSGIWSRAQWPWLEGAGLVSAVTCDPGLCAPSTPRFALPRFLDGENISQIEFEAELAGFLELLRAARSRMMRSKRRADFQSAAMTD